MLARAQFADTPEELAALAGLLCRYVTEQSWDAEPRQLEEIRTLPGEYAAPLGRTLIATDRTGKAVGCVVLRPIAQWCDDCVEMRRLYVVPEARGAGVGRQLAAASEAWARDVGYAGLRLVTMVHMVEAMRLYESLGFVYVEAYRPSTAPDAIFMEKLLG